jgi:hypothetical protein
MSVHRPDRPGKFQAQVEGTYVGREDPRCDGEGAHDVENNPCVEALETFRQAFRLGAGGLTGPPSFDKRAINQ